jgi:PAS domain S-box-containing protein
MCYNFITVMPNDNTLPQPQKIDDQKNAEAQVHQIQLIVENSLDAIIGESFDGTVTSWNGGATKMFGYTTSEMVGKSILVLLPPEMKDELPSQLKRISKGEIIADYDTIRIRKDGSRLNVAISMSPIRDETGNLVGASVIERDIRLRKKAEESMRQIQLVVDNSYDALIGTDLKGVITSWNGGAARMFGYTPLEAIGKSSTILNPPDLKNEVHIMLDKVATGAPIVDYSSVRMRKDGSKFDVTFSTSAIQTKDGTVIGVSSVIRDNTERKKNEEHIKELNEARNKFIEIISHQLRTPLTSINWSLESILGGDYGKLEDVQQKFLQTTYSASTEITRRIGNLLAAMDIEEGRMKYDTEDVDLASLCAGVANEAMKKCVLKNLVFSYIPPTVTLPIIKGDNEKIRIAINMLIENAIGYTKEKGKISMSLIAKGGVARLEVNDTGIGIPQAEQTSIFKRFFRASNASVMQTDAFGIGLFIAKNFVEQHHGKIGFESKEGTGSTFWIEIPFKNEPSNPSS